MDTGLPLGIARLMPKLAGKIESLHVRVPTMNVSALDISLQLQQITSSQAVNDLIQSAAAGNLRGFWALPARPMPPSILITTRARALSMPRKRASVVATC